MKKHVIILGVSMKFFIPGDMEMIMSRKSCRQNINRLRLHRSYTMHEIAHVLGVHVRTVQQWHKDGLKPIDENEKPLLFIGSIVKEYLKVRQKSKKSPLNKNEFYCVKCRQGITPSSDSVSLELSKMKVGKEAFAILIKGNCPNCGIEIRRFSSTNSIFKTPWYELLQKADKTLIGITTPSLITDKVKEN